MTWICSFGVVNCPICQRAIETIKSMVPNIPDKIIDKAIKDQKIDLHQKIEQVSIEIMAGGEPKIEINDKPLTKEGNIPSPSMFTPVYPEPSFPSFEMSWAISPSDYRTIAMPKPPKNEQRTTIVPTSKSYKDMKDNNDIENYRRAGIKAYTAPDGKNTLIVDRKSEIQFQ